MGTWNGRCGKGVGTDDMRDGVATGAGDAPRLVSRVVN